MRAGALQEVVTFVDGEEMVLLKNIGTNGKIKWKEVTVTAITNMVYWKNTTALGMVKKMECGFPSSFAERFGKLEGYEDKE